MNETTLEQALRQNWHLVLVLVLAIVGALAGVILGFTGEEDAVAEVRGAALNPTTVMNEEQMREVLFAPPAPPSPTVREEKQKAVNEHRARYDANPEDPDAEPLLDAMGNLYKQLGDFPNAIWAYQQFLRRFPQSPGRTGVYMRLAGCFDQLKDSDNLTKVFLEMMKEYPPDSNEYKFAEARLNMSDLKVNMRNPNATPAPGPEGTFNTEELPDGSTRYVDSVNKTEIGVPVPPPPPQTPGS